MIHNKREKENGLNLSHFSPILKSHTVAAMQEVWVHVRGKTQSEHTMTLQQVINDPNVDVVHAGVDDWSQENSYIGEWNCDVCNVLPKNGFRRYFQVFTLQRWAEQVQSMTGRNILQALVSFT